MQTEKNQQSGVYLRISGGTMKGSGVFRFNDALSAICDDQGAKIWFHVELWDGVLARSGEKSAGEIQFRCKANDVTAFVESFRKVRPCGDGETFPARIKKDARSFYLLARPLLKIHLTAGKLMEQLESFASGPGQFSDERI